MLKTTLRRLRSSEGFSLLEISVGGLLGSVLLAVMGSFFMSSVNTGTFTEGHSATMNNVRAAMRQVEKEVRGADSIIWCSPVGSCLEVGAQTPAGSFQSVRYKHVGTEIQRELYDSGTASWGDPITVIERVANNASQKVFSCDSTVSLLRITFDLFVEPTPDSDPTINVQTSIRPRNFPSAANCP